MNKYTLTEANLNDLISWLRGGHVNRVAAALENLKPTAEAVQVEPVGLQDSIRELSKWLNEEQIKPIDHVALAQVLSAVQVTQARAGCEWTVDDDGTWNTNCGNSFVFNDGGPKENDIRYCGYCGGKLTEIAKEAP